MPRWKKGLHRLLTAVCNADYILLNDDGPVPNKALRNLCLFFIIDRDWKGTVASRQLGDLEPNILFFFTMMGLDMPGDGQERSYPTIVNNRAFVPNSLFAMQLNYQKLA